MTEREVVMFKNNAIAMLEEAKKNFRRGEEIDQNIFDASHIIAFKTLEAIENGAIDIADFPMAVAMLEKVKTLNDRLRGIDEEKKGKIQLELPFFLEEKKES